MPLGHEPQHAAKGPGTKDARRTRTRGDNHGPSPRLERIDRDPLGTQPTRQKFTDKCAVAHDFSRMLGPAVAVGRDALMEETLRKFQSVEGRAKFDTMMDA